MQHENGSTTTAREEKQEEEESRSLQFLLQGTNTTVPAFFDRIFQVSCAVYSTAEKSSNSNDPDSSSSSSPNNASEHAWNRERALENPVRELVEQGWQVLCDLLEQRHRQLPPQISTATSTATSNDDGGSDAADMAPLLFRDCAMISLEERAAKYSFLRSNDDDDAKNPPFADCNLWAALLDGCSVVVNHCDRRSPWIAALCEDLQRSFPHAYANAYITPAQSQTVSAHADDRDVLVVQVHGRKLWRVYQNIPVPYPYPHEQVGKPDDDGRPVPVPESVLRGPLLLERTLEPGDCLYLPRGYVHQAAARDDGCSFHVTVALATHDWTLAGLLTSAAESVWSRQIPLRRAVDRTVGTNHTVAPAVSQQLQADVDAALRLLRDQVTLPNIATALRHKYERHNRRAAAVRLPLMQSYHTIGTVGTTTTPSPVGREAASTVTLQSLLRAATVEEREQLRQQHQQQSTTGTASQAAAKESAASSAPPRVGLHVREEIHDGILALLKELQQPTPRRLDAVMDCNSNNNNNKLICPLTLLSMARRCVELGALAVVHCSASEEQ